MIQLRNRLGATITLPATISWRRVPLAIGGPFVANAHGDGSVSVGRRRIEARQFTLSGSVYYPSRERIRQEADTILAFLQHPPIEVFRGVEDERRLYAYPQGVSQDWVDAGAELVIDIPMIAPDPYWYGNEVTHTETAAATWQIELGGTAPTHPVVRIALSASGTGLSVTNEATGQAIALGGDYQAGSLVTIDTAGYHADVDGEPVVDRLANTFIASGFVLWPGVNTLAYSGPTADVTLIYRPRWY